MAARKPVTSGLVVVLALVGRAAAAESSPRTITTAGDAVVYVVPDRAIVTVGVETFAAKVEDAKRANRDAGHSFLAAVQAVGVEEKQVCTDAVSVEVVYREQYKASSGVAGYTARRTYAVQLSDPGQVDRVVEAALRGGMNQIVGVAYADSKQREHRDAARRQAAKAAREKAAELAAQFDAAVGPVRTITENTMSWGAFTGNSNSISRGGGPVAGAGASDDGDTLPPGQMAIRASVTAVFDLQDPPPAKK